MCDSEFQSLKDSQQIRIKSKSINFEFWSLANSKVLNRKKSLPVCPCRVQEEELFDLKSVFCKKSFFFRRWKAFREFHRRDRQSLGYFQLNFVSELP